MAARSVGNGSGVIMTSNGVHAASVPRLAFPVWPDLVGGGRCVEDGTR